jgi:hypothetical protein
MPDESTRHGDEKATRSDQAQVFDELLAAYASTAGIAILDSEYRYLWVNQQLAPSTECSLQSTWAKRCEK